MSRITLSTGCEVVLEELNQRLTYEGLIEGLPTTSMNKKYLDRLVAEQRQMRPKSPVHLLTPVGTPMKWRGEEWYPFGTPARLPGVTCIGRFGSRNSPLSYTELTVIWLQNEFAMPIESSVLEEVVRLDWDALAAEFPI